MLWELGILDAVSVAFVGAGGKTTAVYECVEEAQGAGYMAAAVTTTKMWTPEQGFLEWNEDLKAEKVTELLKQAQCEKKVTTLGTVLKNGKTGSVPEKFLKELMEAGVHLYIEADGAKGKWVKVPKEGEPVVPKWVEVTIGILNQKAVGKRICDVAHRPNDCARFLGKDTGERIEIQDMWKIWESEQGIFRTVSGKKIALFSGFRIGERKRFLKEYNIEWDKACEEMPIYIWEQDDAGQNIFK